MVNTYKEAFIKEIDALIEMAQENHNIQFSGLSNNARKFYTELKGENLNKTKITDELTGNGERILRFLYEKTTPLKQGWYSKEIAEGISIPTHSVAGAMQKLVNHGFVEKLVGNPVFYSITEKGRNYFKK